MRESPKTYRVSAKDREPLLRFMLDALRSAGCRIIHASTPDTAPFRITFETRAGERMGIMAYAFLANSRKTKNRPDDEHRFQLKYGSKDGKHHELWQDPFGLYTTILCGINTEQGFFVGADPVLHNPTRMFISIEFKEDQVNRVLEKGWHAWERDTRRDDPLEVLVGGTPDAFLRYVWFEREALGEDQGHRQLLAETRIRTTKGHYRMVGMPGPTRLHELTKEFELSADEVLNVIASAPRLKMAVRGWVAEEHLYRWLQRVPGVKDCERINREGGADLALRFGGVPLEIECKNVLRQTLADGTPRIDFQRTRAAKNNPCSRYYAPSDFNVVAACLHAVTLKWEFRFIRASALAPHKKCHGKLSNLVLVDETWTNNARAVLADAAAA